MISDPEMIREGDLYDLELYYENMTRQVDLGQDVLLECNPSNAIDPPGD